MLPDVLQQRVEISVMACARAGRGGVLHQHSRADQLLDTACLCIGADLRMKLRTALAHFTHVAQDQQAGPRQFAEHQDSGTHRIGIGVVAVVHHRQRLAGQRQLPCA